MTLTWHSAKHKCIAWAWSQHFHRLWLGVVRMTNYDIWVARNMYTGELEQVNVWHRVILDRNKLPHIVISRRLWTAEVRCMLTGVCLHVDIHTFSLTDSREVLRLRGKL